MEVKKITVCLASCNRFDLLQKTIDSFIKLNQYPIERFIVTEDSAVPQMRENIINKYQGKFEFIYNETNLGPFKTFDNMYKSVNTEYIFHCEDDWEFVGNPNFIQNSLDILESDPNINQVWIRPIKDFGGPADINRIFEPNILKTTSGVEYRLVRSPHDGDWCGFSGNPGLRRTADYHKVFPNGLSEFILPNKPMVFSEHNCNLNAMKHGWRAAALLNPSIRHLGNGRSTLK